MKKSSKSDKSRRKYRRDERPKATGPPDDHSNGSVSRDKGGENNRKGESRTDLSIDCKEGNQEQNDQPLSSSELGQIELNPGTEGPTGLREDRVQQGKENEKSEL